MSTPIYIPQQQGASNPNDITQQFFDNFLRAQLTSANNAAEREKLKIEQDRLKLEQERAATQQAQQQAQGVASRGVLDTMAQSDPMVAQVLQSVLQQQQPIRMPFGATSGPVNPGQIGARALDPTTAAAILPTIQQTQESGARVASTKASTAESGARTTLAGVQTRLAEKDLSQADALFALRQRELEAGIAAQEATAANNRAAIGQRQRELELAQKQFQAGVAREARTNVVDADRRYQSMIASMAGTGVDNATARRVAALATYGAPMRPDDKALFEHELTFLNAGLEATAGNKEALAEFLKQKTIAGWVERIGMPDEMRSVLDQQLAQGKSAQEVYDEVARSRASDEAAALAALYIAYITGERLETKKLRGPAFTLNFKKLAEALASITPEGQQSATRQPIGTVR